MQQTHEDLCRTIIETLYKVTAEVGVGIYLDSEIFYLALPKKK